jgi:hypothetical protein
MERTGMRSIAAARSDSHSNCTPPTRATASADWTAEEDQAETNKQKKTKRKKKKKLKKCFD